MSFDVHLQTFNLTGEMVEFVNPFNGKICRGPDDLGVTESERKAISEYLESVAIDEGILEVADGGRAQFFAEEIRGEACFTGCSFLLRSSPTPMLAKAIWQVANLGRMIIWVAIQDAKPIVTHEDYLQNLPTEWETVVAANSKLLGDLLKRGFDGWGKQRTQVFDS